MALEDSITKRIIIMKHSILFTFLFSGSVLANQANIDAIEQAARSLNHNELAQLVNQTSGYDKALANYRLSIAHSLNANTAMANDALDQAIEQLVKLTTQQADNAENWALLAQAYGYKISLAPMKGAYYGPKSASALSKAYQLAPNNPRVHLVKAVSEYNKPALFGGSKQAAKKSLDKAISLFQQDSAIDTKWGYAEAYVWRGLTHIELNNREQAISDWQQALAIEPSYGWPQFLIEQNQ